MQLRPLFGLFALTAATSVAVFACASAPESTSADEAATDESAATYCTAEYKPVCGVNGITYSNRCRAGKQKIAYEGACQKACKGLVCKVGQTCDPGSKCTPTPRGPDGEFYPCDPIPPHCVNVNPCDAVRCTSGTHCEPTPVECLVAPCPVIAACVPDAPADPCATVRCAAGTHCESHQVQCKKAPCPPIAECVPDKPSCKVDADCRLEADYCTGCDCRALATGQALPVCPGPGVRCFAYPCMNHTAACVNGACAVQ